MAVEAQAAGRPVIAYSRGGARDTVRPAGDGSAEGATGVFFDAQTPEALTAAIRRFEDLEEGFRAGAIRRNAERFSRSRYRQAMQEEEARSHRQGPN